MEFWAVLIDAECQEYGGSKPLCVERERENKLVLP